MNPKEFSIFKTFDNKELAAELAILLNEHNIETEIGDNSAPVDSNFGGSTLQYNIEVRIPKEDFKKAEEILKKEAESAIDNVAPDYYLFSFEDDELYDILLKPDEWNEFDYVLSQQILKKRGKQVDDELLNSLKRQRLEDLAKPEGGQTAWIYAGYFFALLGGFLGLIIGYLLWKSKKTLPNGEKVYSYAAKDRKHGQNIFIISVIVFPVLLIIRTLPIFD
ncbi:hypothetical protein POV27_18725 [Aureisphaera galaxeae]|uniref:hypothetical protein n=1 Tax=Aureisphaera galaxeae TaxID=1538023 RepID=UPI0023503F69|nr:hypothetical protein [Aureisphaera galaxeae]MDC8006094.1 hypothetical protein [Aureisphaera galaxeae]